MLVLIVHYLILLIVNKQVYWKRNNNFISVIMINKIITNNFISVIIINKIITNNKIKYMKMKKYRINLKKKIINRCQQKIAKKINKIVNKI